MGQEFEFLGCGLFAMPMRASFGTLLHACNSAFLQRAAKQLVESRHLALHAPGDARLVYSTTLIRTSAPFVRISGTYIA